MKLLDWLCGGGSGPDEAANWTDGKGGGVGDLPRKKPFVCTEQPQSEVRVVDKGRVTAAGAPPAAPPPAPCVEENAKAVNGAGPPVRLDIHRSPQPPPVVKPGDMNGRAPARNGDSGLAEHFSVDSFALTEDSVLAYKELRNKVVLILQDRSARLDQLLEKQTDLPEEVEDDVRLARGKIMIIVKNNLAKFGKLIDEATDDEQGIADLTGFWGLVHKELEDVKRSLGRVEASRLQNWAVLARPPSPGAPPATAGKKHSTGSGRSGLATPTRTPKATPKSANPKLREFMAQRRREMQSTEKLDTDSRVAPAFGV